MNLTVKIIILVVATFALFGFIVDDDTVETKMIGSILYLGLVVFLKMVPQ